MNARLSQRITTLALVLALLFAIAPAAYAVTLNGRAIGGQGLFVMDFETGLELYSYDADTARVPASITKLMTIYLTYEAIAQGKITLDTVVPISEKVRRMSLDSAYNNVPLSYYETYTVEELVDIVLIYSASGATVALAELVFGSEEACVQQMNRKARDLGMSATYYGASGIENNYLTPRAIAILARTVIMDYPEILRITSKTSTIFHGTTYPATNNMLTSQYYEGVDGLKSGTTPAAGYCFVGTAERDGVRLITVVMQSSSATRRYDDTAVLMDYGFSARGSIVQPYLLAPYTDVFVCDWYAQSVTDIVASKVMTGTSPTTFAPRKPLTRADAVVVLHRICGQSPVGDRVLFSDVPINAWSYDAVQWAAITGIAQGLEDGSFGAGLDITREQFAQMLFRCAEAQGLDVSKRAGLEGFEDAQTIAAENAEAMGWAVGSGLLTGASPSALAPESAISRAQCSALLLRFMDYLETAPQAQVDEAEEADDSNARIDDAA